MSSSDPIALGHTATTQLSDQVARRRSGWRVLASLRRGASWVLPSALPVLLFLLAFILRAWGARFGLPEHFYHPDEHAIVDRATAMLHTRDLNPHWFNYPSAYIYVQALTYIPYFLISAARGFGDTIPSSAPYGFYFAGRLMTALVGALTVSLVYVLGKRMFDHRTGLLASLLLTFSLLHTVHSHYVTTDVPVAFFILLSFLFCCLAMEEGKTKHSILAGLFAGLAVSTKYPALILILPLCLCHVLSARWGEWVSLTRRLGLSLGSFVAGFLLGTPYALLEVNTFVHSLGSVLSHYSATQPGFEGSNTGLWYLGQMLTSADALMVALALGGVVWSLVRHKRKDLLLLSFVIPYYLLLSLWRVRFERNLVVLLPFFAILAARLLVEGLSSLGRKWPSVRRWETAFLGLVTTLVILMPARAIVDFDRALSQKDQRTIAAEWVNASIPAGSKVVTEAFSIPLDQDRFEVIQLVRIDSQDLNWYRRQEVEYIIVSDGHWRVLIREPEQYSTEIETYDEIVNHSTLIQEFPGHLPASLARGYITIAIYHFPDVLILELE